MFVLWEQSDWAVPATERGVPDVLHTTCPQVHPGPQGGVARPGLLRPRHVREPVPAGARLGDEGRVPHVLCSRPHLLCRAVSGGGTWAKSWFNYAIKEREAKL